MCGIAGIINTTNASPLSGQEIQVMNEALNHRGPDGSGIWHSGCDKVQLGHKRLSIIDLSQNASQPMMSTDGQYVVVFNGEIYNYRELREECIKLGSRFTSSSDTEVIMEAYRHWQEGCLQRFRGMWAFILFDIRQKKLMIARDPFAIKPLYYAFKNGHFYFASELKAFTKLSRYFREEDTITIQMFLEFAYLERDEWTFYKHIKRFPHAHYLSLDLEKSQTQLSFTRYWNPNSSNYPALTFSQAAKKLKELFYDSMKLHLRSDVPVGACLSGGIDSSAIVSVGTELLNGNSFTTFTSHYPTYREIDESDWAKQIINQTHATPYFIEPTKQLLQQSLDDLLQAQDEPFGSMSIFAQYCVFKKISETNIKVVLDGQGSDEMLAGYLGYVPLYFDELIKKGKLIGLTRELLAFKDMNIHFDAKSKIILALKNWKRSDKKNHYLNQKVSSTHADELEYRLQKLSANFNHFEERLEHLLCDSNIPQLLRYEDRNSMHFSIESRVPFLNTDLVDFVLSLPANYRIKNGYTKAVLREALKDIIPEAVRKRKDKLGFPAPEIQWMNECYGIDVQTAGSLQWRKFICERWRAMNKETPLKTNEYDMVFEKY